MFVQKVVRVKECDVTGGGSGAHVQARLLHRRRAVERAREGSDGARDHQELLDLGVGESVVAAALRVLPAAVAVVRFRRLDFRWNPQPVFQIRKYGPRLVPNTFPSLVLFFFG